MTVVLFTLEEPYGSLLNNSSTHDETKVSCTTDGRTAASLNDTEIRHDFIAVAAVSYWVQEQTVYSHIHQRLKINELAI